jgi:hypothetical protein
MKRVLSIAAVSLILAACEDVPMGPQATTSPPPPPGSAYGSLPPATTFSNQDFAWSAASGSSSVTGSFAYHRGQQRFVCQGDDVLLIPETAWSRRRMIILYGSATAAAIPVSIVRARTPTASTGDYARYVRKTTCDSDNHFVFDNLPSGPWYVVTIGKATDGQGEPIAVTRRITLQGGPQTVTLY